MESDANRSFFGPRTITTEVQNHVMRHGKRPIADQSEI